MEAKRISIKKLKRHLNFFEAVCGEEIQWSFKKGYHLHYHLIVDGKQQAETLKENWISYFQNILKEDISKDAQDIKPATSFQDAIKYITEPIMVSGTTLGRWDKADNPRWVTIPIEAIIEIIENYKSKQKIVWYGNWSTKYWQEVVQQMKTDFKEGQDLDQSESLETLSFEYIWQYQSDNGYKGKQHGDLLSPNFSKLKDAESVKTPYTK